MIRTAIVVVADRSLKRQPPASPGFLTASTNTTPRPLELLATAAAYFNKRRPGGVVKRGFVAPALPATQAARTHEETPHRSFRHVRQSRRSSPRASTRATPRSRSQKGCEHSERRWTAPITDRHSSIDTAPRRRFRPRPPSAAASRGLNCRFDIRFPRIVAQTDWKSLLWVLRGILLTPSGSFTHVDFQPSIMPRGCFGTAIG